MSLLFLCLICLWSKVLNNSKQQGENSLFLILLLLLFFFFRFFDDAYTHNSHSIKLFAHSLACVCCRVFLHISTQLSSMAVCLLIFPKAQSNLQHKHFLCRPAHLSPGLLVTPLQRFRTTRANLASITPQLTYLSRKAYPLAENLTWFQQFGTGGQWPRHLRLPKFSIPIDSAAAAAALMGSITNGRALLAILVIACQAISARSPSGLLAQEFP